MNREKSTLGDVLYAGDKQDAPQETEWVALVQAMARGDQLALHRLYERAHRPVFSLILRITANRESAEELTLDVFHAAWRSAARYDRANGTVIGWLMNQARSRAIDRLRHDQRKKRFDPHADPSLLPVETADYRDLIQAKEEARALREAIAALSDVEREAIETAYFADLSYAEVASKLDTPLGTIKTRIRSGLHKLRQALSDAKKS
ncbi:MAG TPA: sigma-70 family RNA polymerase sigma factor [Burkholderiales bacterium]|nr:sigma-70 family RNA polymerase sigma factor [Burkholderiales bacterium]